MNIAIIGYDRQGRSAFDYWNKPDNTITICDQNYIEGTPEGVATKFGGDYLNDLYKFDLIIRTPGLHPQEIVANNQEDPDILKKVTTVTNEFFKICPTKRIIGVTGTKGKGTTSTLIAKFLEAAGYRVHLGGNIGIAPLELLKNNIKPDDWVVLELANFQLIDLEYSPHIAVCLMIVPEHLDWHQDMYEYIQAKRQVFAHQTLHDIAIFNARNDYAQEIADASPAMQFGYDVPPEGAQPNNKTGAFVEGSHICFEDEKICHIDDVTLPGRHNLENVCAAITAVYPLIARSQKHPHNTIKTVLKSFTSLPYRLQPVAEVNGVTYINDSLGTTPETAMAAIAAFHQPKVMILGGSDKGVSFDDLVHGLVQTKVRGVVIIGRTAPAIASLLKRYDSANKIPSTMLGENTNMSEIVKAATQFAKKGDAVLLSTGCASFGIFKDYKDRGDQFNAAVKALVKPKESKEAKKPKPKGD